MSRDSTLLGAIRGAVTKSAAYEVTPDGNGGHRYRDLGGAQPPVQSSYMRAFGNRSDVQSAMESIQARRELNQGTAFTPGYARRVTGAGRGQDSAQTRAYIQEVDRVAKQYGFSNHLRNQMYSRPQAFAKFKRDVGAANQPATTPAARQTPVTGMKTPAATAGRVNDMQTANALPASQGQPVPESAPGQAAVTPQVQQPDQGKTSLTPYEQYQRGMLSYRDFSRMTRKPSNAVTPLQNPGNMTVAQMQRMAPGQPASAYANASDYAERSRRQQPVSGAGGAGNVGSGQVSTQTSRQPPAPAAGTGGNGFSASEFGISDSDMVRPLANPVPTAGVAGRGFGQEPAAGLAENAAGPVNSMTGEPLTLDDPASRSHVQASGGSAGVCPTCGKPTKAAEAAAVKTAGFWDWLQRRILLNGDVLNAGMKSMVPSGSAPVMVPDLFKPGTTTGEMRPASAIRRDIKNSAKAGVIAGTAYAGIPAGAGYGTAALTGGLGALGGANAFDRSADAVRQAASGDYGGAVRSGTEAALSAGFGAAGKIPQAMTAAKGAAGLLAATDATRAGVYAANGMPGAAASAATGALADSTMFFPGTGKLIRLLRGVGLYGASPVAHTAERNFADNALAGKEHALYGPVDTKTKDAVNSALKSYGVDVKPFADAIAGDAGNAVIDAYVADTPAANAAYAGRGRLRRFMSGLLGTEDLDAVKAREGLVPTGETLTPGGAKAVESGTATARELAPHLKAVQDYQRSWLRKLDRASGWVGRHKGLAATGAAGSLLAGALIWRALANRRRKRKDEIKSGKV